ncbi:MAG: hypothetical protein ACRDVP_06995 [Acidimicrobiales bacterium]
MRLVARLDLEAMETSAQRLYVGEVKARVLTGRLDRYRGVVEHFGVAARTRPHRSASTLLLHVIEGEAVAADGESRAVLGAGETAVVQAGEWHWRGALPHSRALLLVIDGGEETHLDVALRDWQQG